MNVVEVVNCRECTHGEPDEMGDGTPGICCDIWAYCDSPSGQRSKIWPINARDHYCAKGERRQEFVPPTGEFSGCRCPDYPEKQTPKRECTCCADRRLSDKCPAPSP